VRVSVGLLHNAAAKESTWRECDGYQ